MLFVCRLDDNFGFGETALSAFQDLESVLMESGELLEGEELDPRHCEFFEQIPVTVTSKTTWDIQPDNPDFDH